MTLWLSKNVEQVWGGGVLKVGFVLNSKSYFMKDTNYSENSI